MLSQIWHAGAVARELRSTTGESLVIVFPGIWTHSNGPDFSDAMVDIGGRLVTGCVELHLTAGDWYRHGHHLNPAYDAVVLHGALINDLDEPVRRSDDVPIVTVELRHFLVEPISAIADSPPAFDLGTLGASTCLPTLAGGRDQEVRDVLRAKGWERLVAKQLSIQQDLDQMPAGEALYRRLLDGLGLIANREGMAQVAGRLPLVVAEQVREAAGLGGLLAALLGTAGFLPLNERCREITGISDRLALQLLDAFGEIQLRYGIEPLSNQIWTLNRVRPANHPAARLAALADLLMQAREQGLLLTVLQLSQDGANAWSDWLAGATPAIGQTRRNQLVTNVFAPFLAAYAAIYDDPELGELAAEIWERISGRNDDQIVRRTLRQIVGDRRFPIRTALENQGLHQIGRFGCRQLRCFECPIARLAIEHELIS